MRAGSAIRWFGVVVAVSMGLSTGACGGGSEVASGGGDGGASSALATLAVIDTDVSVGGEQGTEGQGLAVGDVVSTSASGFGEVNYFDGSVTRVAKDAEFSVTALSDAEGDRRVVTKLDGGTSWNRVQRLADGDGEFAVETPVATATVTGTAFAVDCVALPASCTFTVVEGTVEVALPDGTVVVLGANESLVVEAAGDAVPVASTLSAADLEGDEWIARNVALDRERGDDDDGGDGDGETRTVTGTLALDAEDSCVVLVDGDERVVVGLPSDESWTFVWGTLGSIERGPVVSDGDLPFAFEGDELRATGEFEEQPGNPNVDCGATEVLRVSNSGAIDNLTGVVKTLTGRFEPSDDTGPAVSCYADVLVTDAGRIQLEVPFVEGSNLYTNLYADPPGLWQTNPGGGPDTLIWAAGDTVTVTGPGGVLAASVDDGNGCGPLIGLIQADLPAVEATDGVVGG